jgi:PAS domain S-box-containing protein
MSTPAAREDVYASMASVLGCVAQPVWVVDHDGVIRFANPAAIAALGYDSLSELEGKPSHQTIHYKHADGSPFPAEECPMLSVRATGESIHLEDWFVRRDGSMLPVEYWSASFEAAAGRGAVVAFTDLTERRQIEQVLRERAEEDLAAARLREELVADEQAALRRMATLVARGAAPYDVFDAVCKETGQLIDATNVNLAHFTSDHMNLTMAGWSVRGNHVPTGTRLPLQGDSINAIVRRTLAPARVDSYEGAAGELAARLRQLGIRSEIAAPVVVDGQVWGALIAGSDKPDPLPEGTEERVARFGELIGLAVSNATAQSDLVAARRRVIEAADAARARLTQDLHDGAQQQFVNTVLNLQLAQERWTSAPERARELIELAVGEARTGIEGLRELAAGIHPSILTNRGLAAALEALVARLPLPVELEIAEGRLPERIEASVYFFCSEGLTNVVKHAGAGTVGVSVSHRDGELTVEVRDDGIGGAAPGEGGSGLLGLHDRIAALDGKLEISSPSGEGTVLRARIPVNS